MDVLTVTFVTACSALVSAAAGPLVSVIVSSKQIRASLISNNRERWTEALRDSLAEYVGLVLSAAMLQEALHKHPLDAIRDPLLLEGQGTVERMTPCVDAIVDAGRAVLKGEWARVKRGD
jgi:hypothetical protein